MRIVAKPQSLRSQAAEQIRDAIVDGTLAADSLHSEQSIALNMGISRTPIREALLQLAGEGLVEFLPQRGVRITSLEADRLEKIFVYRAALDSFCAELLARSRNDKALRELDEQLARQKRIIANEERLEWVRANADFHRVLVDSMENPMMSETMSSLANHTMRIGYQMLHDRKRMKQAFGEHTQIVDAIRAGDPERARQLALQHLHFTSARLKQQMDAASEAQAIEKVKRY